MQCDIQRAPMRTRYLRGLSTVRSRQMSNSRQITTPNWFSIAGAGELDLRLRVGREGGRDLHRNEEVAGENVFVKVTDRRSKP